MYEWTQQRPGSRHWQRRHGACEITRIDNEDGTPDNFRSVTLYERSLSFHISVTVSVTFTGDPDVEADRLAERCADALRAAEAVMAGKADGNREMERVARNLGYSEVRP